MNNMNEIKELTYLCINNPWRFKGNIENIINNASKEKIFNILTETGTAYLINSNLTEKDLLWYFEDKIAQEKKEQGSVDKMSCPGMMDTINWIIDGRKKNHQQYLEDVEKIYSLCMNKAIELNMDISKYPKTLKELTN